MKNCDFFPSCGGCLYLDLEQNSYQKIKIQNLKNDLEKIYNDNIKIFWTKPHSRRRIILQIDDKNKVGFFAKSSKNLVEIDTCFIAEKEISQLILPLKNLLKNFENNLFTQIIITNFDNIIDVVFCIKRELNLSQIQKIVEFAKTNKINTSYRIKNKINPILILQNNQLILENYLAENKIKLELNSDIFIQATKFGLTKIINLISDFIKNNFSQKIKIVDIYSGFGAYSFLLYDFASEIYAFEGNLAMVELIEKNSNKSCAQKKIKSFNRDLVLHKISAEELKSFDLIIINPPRNGAASQIEEIAKSKVKNLIYVSCNPKTFAFDAKILINFGFKIQNISAIDQFYSSNHFELVAIFQR